MLTIVIPIDLQYRARDIIKKCFLILEASKKKNINFSFGHNNRNTTYDNEFLKLASKYNNVKITSKLFYFGEVNASLLRNSATQLVKTKYICLLDVDIWPDFDLLKKYERKIKNKDAPFYILPCLYLTKFGSNKLISGKITSTELINRYFSYSRKEFLHLASPSSITIMKIDDYKKLSGFNEDYNGHGYEDFDFLVRLLKLHNKIENRADFISNCHARSPLFMTGFRRYIGEVCLQSLLDKDIALHLHHMKFSKRKYNIARTNNFELFQKQCSIFSSGEKPQDPTLITQFITLCGKQNTNIADYSILFDNKPGHIDRFDTFKRRLRFLING